MQTVFRIVSCVLILLFASSTNGSCKRYMQELEANTTHTSHVRSVNQAVHNCDPELPTQPSNSSALKFMTFNMQSGFLLSCSSDVARQAQFISEMLVDYVGSQEVVQGVRSRCDCDMPQIIADTAGMSSRFGVAIPYGGGLYGINAATSQTILETKYKYLEFPGVEQRLLVAVRTQPEALQGRNLWFVTSHVDYFNFDARQSQIGQIIAFVHDIMADDARSVCVIAGDFNGGPWDAGYATLKGQGFVNSWERFHHSILDGNTVPASTPGVRFDHIWFKAPESVAVSVSHAEVPDVYLSDHRPYTATLEFSL